MKKFAASSNQTPPALADALSLSTRIYGLKFINCCAA